MRFKLTLLTIFTISLFAFSLKAIEIHSLKTPKGITVWFAPDKSVPIISMEFIFKNAGSAQDPNGLEGLAVFTASMRGEGAGDLDANAFKNLVSKLGVRLSTQVTKDDFMVILSTTLETRAQAVSLLKDVLYRPRFDQDRIDLKKTQVKADLLESYKSPGYKLSRMTADHLYGNHIYGREHTSESIDRITRSDMQRLAEKSFAKSNLVVGVCGNLTSKEVMKMVDDVFGDLPDTVDLVNVPPVDVVYDNQKYVFKHELPQTQVSIIHKGLHVTHPDFMKLNLALSIFGQGFKGRLLQEVREKAGLVYTISSGLSNLEKLQLIVIKFGTENKKVNDSFSIIQREFIKFSQFGVTEQELSDAKKSAIGSYVLGHSSTIAVADTIMFLQRYNFPITFMNDRSNMINSITLKEMNRFIKTFFNPNKTLSFMVGNPVIDGNFQTEFTTQKGS